MKPIIYLSLIFTIVFVALYQSNKDINNIFLEVPIQSAAPLAAHERSQFHLDKRLSADQDYLPIDAYKQAKQKAQRLKQFSTKVGKYEILNQFSNKSKSQQMSTAWEPLGPGNIGGRTRSFVFHPNNNNVLFAAGVSGGVWKTENSGEMWFPIADDLANINVGALAIDNHQPETIYAGTGELYRKTLRPYSSMTGAGIFKTIDGGQTWLQLSATVNENFMYVSDIVISPNDNKVLYAATNTGVWRSLNGGVTFSQTLFPNDGLGNQLYEGCNDLSIREDKEDDWLLVTCASRSQDDRYYLPGLLPFTCNGPCDARIYVNTDAKDSDDWQVSLSEVGMGRTQLAIHKANQNIIYASSANTDGGPDLNGDTIPDLDNGLHAIFRSDDGGLTWNARLRNTDNIVLNTQLFSYAEGALGNFCGGSRWYYSAGWYNQAIAVNPINPNEVWVGGMEIYRSVDGGRNFGLASHWDALFYTNPNVHGAYVHADIHALAFHPAYDGLSNRSLFASTDGGIYFTSDSTQNVTYGNTAACNPPINGMQWQGLVNNYGVTQFYSGAVFPDGKAYMGGAQDNGTNYGDDFRGHNNWYQVSGGDGSELAINPDNLNNWYVSSQNANIYKTFNRGATFQNIRQGLSGNFIFITPFKLDPNNSNRIYLGGQYLWRSDNQGNNWTRASSFLGSQYNDLVSALAIAPGNSSHVIYANQSKIYVTRNALSNNPQSISSSPRLGWVSSVEFEPNNSQVVYATYSTFGGAHVFKSVDGGNTWQSIDGVGSGKLPDVPVHSIVIDPNNTQRLFIGTDLGVFVSIDGGQNWLVENTGFSQAITERLVINKPTDGSTPYLFAFTYGRGVWRVPLNQLDAEPDFIIDGQTSGLWFNPSESGHGLHVEIFDSNGTPKLYLFWYAFLDGQPVWITGIGDIVGNRSDIEVFITGNTGFPVADFVAKDVEVTPWGTVSIEFSGDNIGQFSWSSVLPEYNNGSMPIQRLTSIAENSNNSTIKACHSGAWYNPEQSGHGFMVDVTNTNGSATMVLTWYTYFEGQQFWVIATGTIDDDTAVLTALSGSGTSFPPNFDTGDAVFTDWGEISFDIIDDDHAQISWQTTDKRFNSGSIEVQRITSLVGHACE
ncbi:MAG: WD40/YVTN/BNR-like repeat-containing protein [Marinicellaceae bacterium]